MYVYIWFWTVTHQLRAYPSFCSMKLLEVLNFLPLGEMLVHRRVVSQWYIHQYPLRGTMWELSVLPKNTAQAGITMLWSGL